MKHKFSSMGRVAIALVLALSLSLVMAVPVMADITDPGGDGGAGAPELTSFAPQEVLVGTENTYTVIVEDTDLFVTDASTAETLTDAVVINFPQAGGYALWTGTTGVSAVLAGTISDATTSIIEVKDADLEITAIKVTIVDSEGGSGANTVDKVTVTFTSTSNNTPDTYEWTVDMKDDGSVHSATGTANVVVVTEITDPTILSVAGTAYQNSNDVIVITFSKQVKAEDDSWSANEFTILSGTTELNLTGAVFDPAGANLATTLTITLNETNAYLVVGETLSVTPVVDEIDDVLGNSVAADEVTGSITGDTVVPTVTLTYDLTMPVKAAETLKITATFSEDMADTPQIAIATLGDGGLGATNMAMPASDRKVWEYNTWEVASGTDETGTATVTITGTDLAGHHVGTHTDDDFEIDNTLPTIAVANIAGTTISGEGDTIVITFSEPVTAEDADWTDRDEFTSILSDTRTIAFANATIAIDETGTILTITLNEATPDNAYLVNGEMITVTLDDSGDNDIFDAAFNAMLSGDANKIVGTTAVSGDTVAPTIVNIVGTDASPDTIDITFSEAVVPADGTWSSNEFALVENPDGAPINITNATASPDGSPGAGMAVVLTFSLNEGTDDAYLDTDLAISVTPATGAIVDLAGNPLADTEVSSADADTAAPAITSIVGTTIQDAGDTIVITFSEAVAPSETPPVWSANELGIESPDTTNIVIDHATFSIDGTNTILTITLDESVAGDATYLVNENLVLVTPATGADAIEDVDGNVAANTEVTSAAVVGGDTVLPTITSIVGTIITEEANDIIIIDFSEAVDVGTWSEATQLAIENADLGGATFAPTGGITTSLVITLSGHALTAGDTLTVTPVVDMILDLAGNKMSVDPIASAAPVQPPSEVVWPISLEAGWNLISLPLIPTDPNIDTALADLTVSGTVLQVRTFLWEADELNEKYWTPTGSVISLMEDGQGYWIEMSAADILFVAGSEQATPGGRQPSYDLHVGWNLIGFKSLTEAPPSVYLDALFNVMEAIYGYDADAGIYFIPGEDVEPDFLPMLQPGSGYWVAVSNAGTIYP